MKFNLPTSPFLIFGLWHSVEVRELTDAENAELQGGYYDDTNYIIVIDKTVPEHRRYEIFLHECGEAYNHLSNLKMNHTQISVVGLGYHDMICNVLEATECDSESDSRT